MPNPIRRRRMGGFKYPTLAAHFTAASVQYLSIADNASLSMADLDFTVAAWIYLDTLGVNRAVVSKGNSAFSNTEYILGINASNKPFFEVSNGAGLGSTVAESDPAFTAGTWHLIVGWHDSVANVVGIDDDAKPAPDTNAYTSGSYDSALAFTIGAQSNAGSPFDGRIDMVAVWKRVISFAEIGTLYNGGVGLAYRDLPASLKTSLQGWWDLDGTFNDASGNGNNLAQTGGVTYVAGKR